MADPCECCRRFHCRVEAAERERDLGESNARLVMANRRAEKLEADVLELEARLRLAKSSAIAAAQVAQTALARMSLYERVVHWARDWCKPPLSIMSTRALCDAVAELETELAKRAAS